MMATCLQVLAPETPAWEADYHAKEQASLIGQGLLRDFPDVVRTTF